MLTVIDTLSQLPEQISFICCISRPVDVPSGLFTKEERDYIASGHKEHKTKLFHFNDCGNVRFVYVAGRHKPGFAAHELFRKTGYEILQHINRERLHEIAVMDINTPSGEMLALAEGLALSNYQFVKYKTGKNKKLNPLATIYLVTEKDIQKEVDELNILVDATQKCRDMVNEPVSTMNVESFAEEIKKLGKSAGLKVDIFNRNKIESLKMGGILAVNKGSVDPPAFAVLEWKPEGYANKKPVVLIGKGVVFDTGGMNLKTGNYMNNMKCDMAGGAAVAAAIWAVARAGIKVHVIGLIPATDNRTDGNAMVSGDVITTHNGTTVEVINTDAEGRLLLADALSYAAKYKPSLVITIATLTGSAARAIGKYGIVAMQSGAARAFEKIKKSGDKTYERIVEFPLWDEYRELLDSDVADIKNIGGQDAGAITAGKFLQHFAGFPFIHLDVAGPAFVDKTDNYRGNGATGTGVRLLFDLLKNL